MSALLQDSLRQVWLFCHRATSDGNYYTVEGTMGDGTGFTIRANSVDVKVDNPADGCWLRVHYMGNQNGTVGVSLPAPDLRHGHRIYVRPDQIDKSDINHILMLGDR